MKLLKTTTKDIEAAPKSYVRYLISKEKQTKVRELESGITEVHIGVGPYDKVDRRKFRIILRTIVRVAQKYGHQKIAIELEHSPFPKLKKVDEEWVTSTIAENFLIANYEFSKYKTDKKQIKQVKEILICGSWSKKAKAGLTRGEVVAEYVNACRDIANTPGGDMTPTLLGKEAEKLARKTKGVTVKVLDEKQVRKEKMGALLGVGGAAKDKPRFIILEYWGAGKPAKNSKVKSKEPIVFVGKGITFDSGGLQVKPGMSMYEMHLDMSGGAAVMAAVTCAAKLKLRKNIIALVPAAENAISSDALRPGDVLKSMSGKTIDVLHTDAEGRLVLADALTYAKRYNPKLVIDVATLTGAALVALGQHASAILTKDRKLEDMLRDLGEESGDYVSPLPLWDEYKQYTKGVHGDIANLPISDPSTGGTINGAMFLSHFTEDFRWAHIDMAPRMTSVSNDKLAKGATGEPTRLLVHIAEHF